MTRPSTVVSTFSRLPICALWIDVSRILAREPTIRPSSKNVPSFFPDLAKAAALLSKYGMSKFWVLYPVMMSGSTLLMKVDHFCSNSSSVFEGTTSAPEIGAQPFKVKITWHRGSSEPCNCTTHEIWITGSFSGSGKWPLRPWHSMSVANTRRGANRDHDPSQG
jgi:hypothetical protein